jgi:hypothetical protein
MSGLEHTGPRRSVINGLRGCLGLSLTLALAACSSSSSPLLLPPTPQNMQTGQLPAKSAANAAEQAQLKAAIKNCPTAAEPAKTIGVSAMLEQARNTNADVPKTTPLSKSESDCLAARVKAQLIETSSQPPGAPAATAATPAIKSKSGDLTIDFDSETAPVSPKDQRAIAAMLAAKKGGSANKIRIFAGRGGNGNMFDQAVVAQKRANRVKELLPPGMVVSVEFDPQQIDDTVRIEFVDQS